MKIFITNKANLKLKNYVTLVDTEISGMAKSEITSDQNIVITDFMIFDQEVSGSSTIISDESQAKFLNELVKKNIDPSIWNIWWHSHCDMNVFWSGTDDKTIEDHTTQAYLISLVVNKKMKMKARLDVFPKDLSPFKKSTYCKFDIDEIKIVKTETEEKRENQYEADLLILEQKFNEQMKLLTKKYTDKDETKMKNYCQNDINKKVKIKTYSPIDFYLGEDYEYNNYGKRKQFTPSKKWNWITGIQNDLFDDYDNWINK